MSLIVTQLSRHDREQEVWCCCCGNLWQERWVSVVLGIDEVKLGSLCPACLNRAPQETADLLRRFAQAMQHQLAWLRDLFTARPTIAAEVSGQATRILDEIYRRGWNVGLAIAATRKHQGETVHLLNGSSETMVGSWNPGERSKSSSENRGEADANREASAQQTLDKATATTDWLLMLVERFPHGKQWSISLNDLMRAEAFCAIRRMPKSSTQERKATVDARYEIFGPTARGAAAPQSQ